MQKTATKTYITTVSHAKKQSRVRVNPVRIFQLMLPLLTFGVVLFAWHMIYANEIVESFLIPAPRAVADSFVDSMQSGALWEHTSTTLYETLVGLILGGVIGVTLGYLIARIPILESILSPVIVAFQSTPVVAYAPLLVLWFGTGVESKIVTSMLIVFFPMMMNTIAGIRAVPAELHDLMRVSQGTWWQTFSKLELPSAMPILITGLKTSATLAVIGAVVGEFVAARQGLGALINLARNSYNTPLMFVGVITLAIVAGSLYGVVTVMERRLLAWQKRGRR